MRRSSNAVLQTQTSEPLIVVQDPDQDEEDNFRYENYTRESSEDESPTMNPYLLSPYGRDVRKHSLPTPQCSGITASQVRRLSERGESVGPGPRQAEFLATLSTAPQPTPGGRRHSVVTISKVPPPLLFGRNRRESVANFSSGGGFPGRVLPNRRESIACPPSTEPRGSIHNLQLDIMDDIVQARKVRMKLWNTSSEKVCEVQPLDDGGAGAGGGVQRYTNSAGRRFSDFVGTTLAPIPSTNKRRASELPQTPTTVACTTTSASKHPTSGIVCTNTDLISILSSLSTSATEINQYEKDQPTEADPKLTSNYIQQKRSRLKSNRSNSFDISILYGISTSTDSINRNLSTNTSSVPSNWFVKRHQPKTDSNNGVTFNTKPKVITTKVVETEPGKVMWDERSGSLVDAHALGSAIEVFLRQTSPETATNASPTKVSSISSTSSNKVSAKSSTAGRSKSNWFSKGDDDSTETCDSSLCSTLKDLFVK